MRSEIIIFVPGMSAKEQGEHRRRLTDGMGQFAQRRAMPLRPDADAPADATASGRVFYTFGAEGSARTIDVQEVFWNDLLAKLSDQRAFAQFTGGFKVLFYWVASSRVMRVLPSNKYLFFSSLAFLFLYCLWYYGVIAAALVAIGSEEGASFLPLPETWRAFLAGWGRSLGSWEVWLFASAFLAMLPVTAVVDLAYSTKRYFQNEDDMADKIQTRIAAALNEVGDENKHDLVTVVAYSFGAIPAIQVLAGYPARVRTRLITLGAPLTISSARSSAVEAAVSRLAENDTIVRWDFLHSDEDLLGSSPPGSGPFAGRLVPHKLTFSTNLSDKLTRKNHTVYFDCDKAFEVILNPPPPTPSVALVPDEPRPSDEARAAE